MPNVIDAFLMTLDLDASGFKSGADEAEKTQNRLAEVSSRTSKEIQGDIRRTSEASTKQAKDMVSGQKVVSEGFTKLRDTAIGMLAVFAAGKGMKDFVTSTTSTNAATGRLANNLGMSTRALSTWELAVQSVGGTAADASASIQSMVTTSENLKLGIAPSAQAMAAYQRMGIQMSDLQDPEKATEKIAAALHNMKPADAQMFGQAIGWSQPMINLAEQYGGNIQKLLAQFSPAAVTNQEAADAQGRQAAFNQLDTTLTAIGNELLSDVNPYLKAFLDDLQQIAAWGLKHPGMFAAAVGAGGALAGKGGASILRKLATSILGKGGPGAAAEASEATEAAEVLAAGGAVTLSPAVAAALAAFTAASVLIPTPAGPAEEQELQRRGLGLGQAKPLAPDVEADVRFAAQGQGIDPNLAVALFRQEGGGYRKVSPAGAFGPAQLMPETAASLGVATSPDDPNYSWETNAEAGVKYFAQMMARYHGDKVRALVAYNWGPGHADKWDGKIADLPLETQNYVARILAMSSGSPTPAATASSSGLGLSAATESVLRKLRADQNPGPIGLSPQTTAFLKKLAAPKPPLVQHAGMYQSAITGRWMPVAGAVNSHNVSSETNVQKIEVHTKATDAAGIAKDLQTSLARYSYTKQLGRGLA
jgi:soluble lytic murein transglycosylase-like protein